MVHAFVEILLGVILALLFITPFCISGIIIDPSIRADSSLFIVISPIAVYVLAPASISIAAFSPAIIPKDLLLIVP